MDAWSIELIAITNDIEPQEWQVCQSLTTSETTICLDVDWTEHVAYTMTVGDVSEVKDDTEAEFLRAEAIREFVRTVATTYINMQVIDGSLRRDWYRHRPEQQSSAYGHAALPIWLGAVGGNKMSDPVEQPGIVTPRG